MSSSSQSNGPAFQPIISSVMHEYAPSQRGRERERERAREREREKLKEGKKNEEKYGLEVGGETEVLN